MVKQFKKISTIIAAILVLCLTGLLLVNLAGSGQTQAASGAETEWTDAVRIALDNGTMIAVFEDTSAQLSDEDYAEREISFDGTELNIGKAGTYILSGTMKGKINVSSSKKKDVILVLDGLTVENDADEALTVKKTGTLTLVLNEGTENVFTSGTAEEEPEATEEAAAEAAATEEEVQEDDAKGGTIHIKADTYIQGTGSLIVNGYINNGIHVTKTLSIDEGNVTVNAVNNGIKVKDYFFMGDGSLSIQAGNDGIKAEKDAEIAAAEVTDPNTGEVLQEAEIADPEKGDILIDGGNINIGCYGSGFQARLNVVINGGDIVINSSKDAINADHIVRVNNGTLSLDSYQDGIQAGEDLTIAGGTLSIKTEGDYKHKSGEGESFGGGRSSSSSNTPSRKGLKSDGNLTITAGTVTIDASDDAVHCAERLRIEGGDLTISTGDDGLHADFYLDILDGAVNILTSYEGIEANQISVYGGDVSVIANDDGFNGNGGSGSFGGPGGGTTTRRATETPNLNISGGTVYVNSGGDGLDSNGNITVSGGYIVVDGPTSSMNGALDGGTENGGAIKISGGTIFAGGASGMAEGFSSNSSQNSFMCTFSTSYRSGAKITIYDVAGNVLFTHKPASGGNSLVFSCPELKVGETYILKIAEYEMELTLSKVNSSFRVGSDGTVTAGSGGSNGGPGR